MYWFSSKSLEADEACWAPGIVQRLRHIIEGNVVFPLRRRGRQATDLNVDIRSCRRTCGSKLRVLPKVPARQNYGISFLSKGSLESEIESEEARAAALREARS